MTNNSFLKKFIFAVSALSVALFVSCDDDFNLLGADVIGGDIHSDMIRKEVNVIAYDRPTGAVQANNMAQNQLGIYDNPVFGKTISHLVTQIQLGTSATNPTLFEPVIDSVYLYVPYYATSQGVDTDGETTVYKLDSTYIIGDQSAKFDLKVYRNGYFLRDADPSATDNVQRYYSDDKAMVENMVVGSALAEVTDFTFSPKEIQRRADVDGDGPKEVKVIERLAPGIFMDLNKAAMQEAIFSTAARPNLLNNSIFENYFRGLYFKVEQTGAPGAMCIPKFTDGVITIKYTDYEVKTDGTQGTEKVTKTMTFNLKGNTINFFDNTYSSQFNSAVATSDVSNGDDKLYLKGGAGSMVIIDPVLDEIKELKTTLGANVLINEANLVFYVGDEMLNKPQPPRIYLYDLKNRRPIVDYTTDRTTNISNPKGDKTIYGGILDTVNKRYKIRLTNYVKDLIKGDSLKTEDTHKRLGLVITDNIGITTNYKLKTSFTEGDDEVKEIPYSSVQALLGTVLYGTGAGVPNDKKIKLEIYYTKPKE